MHQTTADTITSPTVAAEEIGARIFIDLAEAGRIANGRDKRWVENHLTAFRSAGAPEVIELKTKPTDTRCVARLVDRQAWVDWIRSLHKPVAESTVAMKAPVYIPSELQSPAARRAYAMQQKRKGR